MAKNEEGFKAAPGWLTLAKESKSIPHSGNLTLKDVEQFLFDIYHGSKGNNDRDEEYFNMIIDDGMCSFFYRTKVITDRGSIKRQNQMFDVYEFIDKIEYRGYTIPVVFDGWVVSAREVYGIVQTFKELKRKNKQEMSETHMLSKLINQREKLLYWMKKANLLEKCLKESPCDPDITPKQIEAHKELNEFLSQGEDYPSEKNLKDIYTKSVTPSQMALYMCHHVKTFGNESVYSLDGVTWVKLQIEEKIIIDGEEDSKL